MTRQARIGSVVAGVGLLLAGTLVVTTRAPHATPAAAPVAPRTEPAGSTEVVVTRDVPAASPAGPISSPCRATPPAPLHEAPPLGLDDLGDERGGQTSVSVDPLTGLATVWERDVDVAGLPALRRARTLGDASRGLFGRGWRGEVDATLHRAGDDFVVVRLDGATLLRRAAPKVWLSPLGELQSLIETEAGFQVDDPAGRVHRFDRAGRLVEIVGEVRLERAPRQLRLIGRTGTITLELDPEGRAVGASGAGVALRYAYDGDELVRVEGSARRSYTVGAATFGVDGLLRATLDAQGKLARLEAPGRGAGFVQTYEFGLCAAAVSGPLGTWRYTDAGDGWRIETPAGVERAWVDARCRITAHQPVGGPRVAVPHRDALERALAKTPASVPAASARASLDARGLVTGVEVEGGRRFGFERDAAGRVVATDGPGGRRAFERDAAGRVKTTSDGSDRTIRAIRNGAGQVESLLAGELELTFEHDLAGRPTLASDGARTDRWTWDAQGRLLTDEGPDGRLLYSHGPAGEQVETPWGAFARRADEAGRVTTLESPAGAFRFSHDDDGRVTRVRAPNGVVTDVLRDAAGREVRRTARGRAGPVLELATTRDAGGRATAIARDGATIAFSRDARGRLTGARGAGLDLSYGWTPGGDRTDATHDRAGRLVARGTASAGVDRFEHDAAGRVTRRVGPGGETRYGWDPLGRLARVERSEKGATSVVTYGYDALGRLATRTTSAGTTRYVHERDQLLAELGPGEQVRVWVHAPGVDEPLAYGDGRRWTFVHGDATATTLAYTDGAGARVAQAVIGPFGEVVRAPGQEPVLFAGRPVDPDTGLVNLRARWYSPELGRFLDPDLLGVAGGTNPWLYADGDPVERRDPTGLAPEGWDVAPITASTHSPPVENAGPGLLARLWDRARTYSAISMTTAELLLRRAQHEAMRFDFYDPTGTKPHGSTNPLDNLIIHIDTAAVDLVLTASQKALAIGADVVAPDDLGTGAARGALDGAKAAALAPVDRFERDAQLLLEDDHSMASAGLLAAARALAEPLPVEKGHDALSGNDSRAFIDTGEERELTRLERGAKAVQAVAETILLVAPVVGPGALAAERAALAAAEGRAGALLAEEGLAASRVAAAEAKAATAARGPNTGLAQVLDPKVARGAAQAEGAAARGAAAEGEAAEASAARRAEAAEARVARDAEAAKARAAREAETAEARAAREAAEAETKCFLAGTLVDTLTGRRPIEAIAASDLVLSRSEETGAYSWRRVRRLLPGATRLVAHVLVATALHGSAVDLQTIDCTPNHPTWREGSGFVRADALRAGDVLSSPSGLPVVVAGVEVAAQVARTYNFEVEEDHTYFVAGRLRAPAIWVHNDCTLPTGELGGRPTGPPTRTRNDIALRRENEAAETLAGKGYRVEQNPKVTTNPDYEGTTITQDGNPDYLIEGRIFDCYSPTTANAGNIVGTVAGKVNKGQAARIVLNLSGSEVEVSALTAAIERDAGIQLAHLQELLVITRSGEVVRLFVR